MALNRFRQFDLEKECAICDDLTGRFQRHINNFSMKEYVCSKCGNYWLIGVVNPSLERQRAEYKRLTGMRRLWDSIADIVAEDSTSSLRGNERYARDAWCSQTGHNRVISNKKRYLSVWMQLMLHKILWSFFSTERVVSLAFPPSPISRDWYAKADGSHTGEQLPDRHNAQSEVRRHWIGDHSTKSGVLMFKLHLWCSQNNKSYCYKRQRNNQDHHDFRRQ